MGQKVKQHMWLYASEATYGNKNREVRNKERLSRCISEKRREVISFPEGPEIEISAKSRRWKVGGRNFAVPNSRRSGRWEVREINTRDSKMPDLRQFGMETRRGSEPPKPPIAAHPTFFGLSNIPSFQQTSTFHPCNFQLSNFLSSRVKFKLPTFQLADISTSQVSNFFQLSNFLFS